MDKENVLDLFHASKEQALDAALSEVLPEIAKEVSAIVVSEATASIICEMMLDAIYDEIQESKVAYGINGFVNLMCIENPSEDMTLMFFKTLTELSDLDIRVLKCFSYEYEENYYTVMQEVHISDMQYRFVKEKLERFGLLQNKNTDIRDMDLSIIIDYLKDVNKQSNSKNPKSVKFPSKIKRIANSNSYEITSLGREFLRLLEPIAKS